MMHYYNRMALIYSIAFCSTLLSFFVLNLTERHFFWFHSQIRAICTADGWFPWLTKIKSQIAKFYDMKAAFKFLALAFS